MTRGRSQSLASVMYKPTGDLCRRVIQRVISAVSVRLAASLGVQSRGLVTDQVARGESETVCLAPLTVRDRPVQVAGNRWHIQSLVILDVRLEVPWNTIWSGGTVVTVPRITGQLVLPDYRSPLTPDAQALVISLREVAEDPSTPLATSATLQGIVRLVEEQLQQTDWVVESLLIYLSNPGLGEDMVLRGTGLRYCQSRGLVRSWQLTSSGELVTVHDLDYSTDGDSYQLRASVVRVQPHRVGDLPQFKTGRLTGLSRGSQRGRYRLDMFQLGELAVRGVQVDIEERGLGLRWTTASLHGVFELYSQWTSASEYQPIIRVLDVGGAYHLTSQPLRMRLVSLPLLENWVEKMWNSYQVLQHRWIRHQSVDELSGRIDDLQLEVWYRQLQATLRARWITSAGLAEGIQVNLRGPVSLAISVRRLIGDLATQTVELRDLEIGEGTESCRPNPARMTIHRLRYHPDQVEINGGSATYVGSLVRRLMTVGQMFSGGSDGSTAQTETTIRSLSLSRRLGGLSLVTHIRDLHLTSTGQGSSLSTVTLGGRSLGTWAVTWRKR